MKAAIVLAITIAVSACATTGKYEAILQTWVGQPVDNLVMAWGPPQSSYPLQNGGQVLEWVRQGSTQVGGYTYSTPQTTYQSGTASAYGSGGYAVGNYSGTSTTYVQRTTPVYNIPLVCRTRITTNENGIVTNWSWQGNACKSTR